MKRILLLAFTCFTFSAQSTIYTVTNNAGNDWWPTNGADGSLMRALDNAKNHAGNDTIRFAINGGTSITSLKTPLDVSDNGGLLIDGLSTLNGTSIIISFYFQVNSSNVTISDVIFTSSDIYSLYIAGSNNIIKNCTVRNTSTNTNNHSLSLFSGTGNQVTNCTVNPNGGHGITIEPGSSSNSITGCTIKQSGSTSPSNIGIVVRGAGSNTISNTTVDDINHNGLGLLGNTTNNTISNCTFSNNLYSGIAFGDSDSQWGAETPATSSTVTNCTIHGNGSTGILVGGGSINNTIEKTKVYNNCLIDGPAASTEIYKFAGIYIKGNNTTVDSCYVYGNSANGILVDNNAGSSLGSSSTIKRTLVGLSNAGVLDGNSWNGIFVRYAGSVTIEHSVIVDNGDDVSSSSSAAKISGIRLQEISSATIQNNYIGTTASKANYGNVFDGITLHTNVSGVSVLNNVICNNGFDVKWGPNGGGGIANRSNSDNNIFRGNFIGSHQDLTDGGNNDYGISFEDNCSGNTVGGAAVNQGNVIANSKNASGTGTGVWLVTANADNNVFYNNAIRNNVKTGILIERGSSNNIIGASGQGNLINGNAIGIQVKNNGANNTNSNTLRFNSFSCNTVEGISLSDNGNDLYGFTSGNKIVTTNISESRVNFVSGTAPANAVVDLYARDSNCPVACDSDIAQGVTYVTSVNANASGNWEFDITLPANTGGAITKTNVIVLATQNGTAGQTNTSEFSICQITCNAPTGLTINGSNNTCIGSSVTLTANSGKAAGDYRYTWYLNSLSNQIETGLNDSTISVNTAGTYFVKVANTSDEITCADTSNGFAFTLNPLPVVTVNNATICTGGAAVPFTASTALPAIAASWVWSDKGSGTSQTTTGNTAGNYVVEVTDNNGCKASGTGVLTVNTLPAVSVNNVSVCDGAPASTFTATSATAIAYLWSGAATTTLTASTTSGSSAGTYTVEVTDANNCKNTASGSLTINPLPTVTIDDLTLCTNESKTLTPSSTATVISYLWSDASSASSLNVNAAGDYWVEITDNNNCKDSDTATVNQAVSPTVNVGGDTSFCSKKGETYVATITHNGIAGGTYSWSISGNSESITVTAPGTITGTYTDINGCLGSDDFIINEVCIVPKDTLPTIIPPNTPFTPIGGNLTPSDIKDGTSIMEIYDRWGLKMFETTEKIPVWNATYNGNPVLSGVYFWIWKYEDINDVKYNSNGFVQVIQEK